MSPLFPRATLFQAGQFVLHSGEPASWKIECDALTDEDWIGLATMARGILPPFSWTEGVPRGGLPLAVLLRPYCSQLTAPRLIVDDVLTTGASLQEHMTRHDDIGLVVFARGPLPSRVTALFQMPQAKSEAQ